MEISIKCSKSFIGQFNVVRRKMYNLITFLTNYCLLIKILDYNLIRRHRKRI